MRCFRESLTELGIAGRIIAVDATPLSSAAQLADQFYVVPKCADDKFISEIQAICETEEIRLLVPTIDTELPVYAQARETLRSMGVFVAISSPETVAICCDKVLTHRWLLSNHHSVPQQAFPELVLAEPSNWRLPLVIKPARGSGSIGVRLVQSFRELEVISSGSEDLIVQELVQGVEHTVNLFVNRDGKCVCAVPHARLETRAGEVSKGITVKDASLMECASRLVEALPGAFGPLNVQCFLTREAQVKIIETNARFGGGYPLAHHAGACMTRWLIEESIGREASGPFDAWYDGLTMLRYDDAVYIPKAALEANSCATPVYRFRS
jgi:carbamoyl-phosphate synthase large subunit